MRCCDHCVMNPVSHFDPFLQAAATQPKPQRLLFVFAAAEAARRRDTGTAAAPCRRRGRRTRAERVRVRGGLIDGLLALGPSDEPLTFV